jgi:hypothetical protein
MQVLNHELRLIIVKSGKTCTEHERVNLKCDVYVSTQTLSKD